MRLSGSWHHSVQPWMVKTGLEEQHLSMGNLVWLVFGSSPMLMSEGSLRLSQDGIDNGSHSMVKI